MDSHQIRNIISRHSVLNESVWGVFPRDRIPKFPGLGGCIVNSDNSNGKGKHWLALWMSEDGIEFFDSFARPPRYYGLSLSGPVFLQDQLLQSRRASTCGHHCLYFLYYRALGLSMSSIVNVFSDDTNANDLLVSRFVSLL